MFLKQPNQPTDQPTVIRLSRPFFKIPKYCNFQVTCNLQDPHAMGLSLLCLFCLCLYGTTGVFFIYIFYLKGLILRFFFYFL